MPEPTDNAPETEAKHSPGWGRYAIWAFGIMIVYLLSSGPAFRLEFKGIISPKMLIIYDPLGPLYFATPLRKPLGMYWHLWRPELYDSGGKFVPDPEITRY